MKVWLINAFWDLPQEGNRPQRYWLMARAFARAGHDVTYWTSDFSHATKKPRVLKGFPFETNEYVAEGIRVKLIPTQPYTKNISLKRAWSHHLLARTFARFAQAEAVQPDVIVATNPPLGLCAAAQRHAQAVGAKFVCDIQDAWPETFERVVPQFLLGGWRRVARRLYCAADAITGTGQAYLDLAARYGATAPARVFGQAIEMRPMPTRATEASQQLKLVYCGNMSLSYDLATLIQAVKELPTATLDLAGNGPSRPQLEALAADCERIRFHGYLGEEDLARLLQACTVGVIPMFPESCVAVPGKLADYAAAQLRVVECLGGECAAVVKQFDVGTHYQAKDVASLKAALQTVFDTTPKWTGFRDAFDGDKLMADYVTFVKML